MTTNPEEAAEQYSEVNRQLSEYQQEIARLRAEVDAARCEANLASETAAGWQRRAEAAEQRAGALEGALKGLALCGTDESPLWSWCDEGWTCTHPECIEGRAALTRAAPRPGPNGLTSGGPGLCSCGEPSPDSIVIHRLDHPCVLREAGA